MITPISAPLFRTRVFNVGHGDSILLSLDNELIVIRDWGSISKNAAVDPRVLARFAISAQLCKYNNIEAILTHPHKDHYSGFEELHLRGQRNIFEKGYIPWLDFKTINTLSGVMLKLSVFVIYILRHNNGIKNKAENWIKMAPLMADLSKMLIGVEANKSINHWSPRGNIHWPPPQYDAYNLSEYNKLYEIAIEIQNSIDDAIAISLIEDIIEPIRKILNTLTERENTYESRSSLAEVVAILNRINELTPVKKEYIGSGVRAYSKAIDNHSIVYSLADNSALYLSDFHDTAMNYMARNYLSANMRFGIIKSAHHGSRLGNDLINGGLKSDLVVHCCGASKKSYYGPCQKYLCISPNIVCTDWNYHSKKWNLHPSYRFFKTCCECY